MLLFEPQSVYNSVVNAPRFKVQTTDLSDECSYVFSDSDL